jgi:magnesium transporter
MPETKFYHFPPKGSFYAIGSLQDAIETTKEAGFVWFNFYKPSHEQLSSLVEPIGIHPLSVEDCFDEQQLPKIEYFRDNTFIIFNSFTYSLKKLFIDEVDIFIGDKFLITVSGYNSGARQPLDELPVALETAKFNSAGAPDLLMHKILDYLVDEKYKSFDVLEDELENAEEQMLEDVEKFNALILINLRKNLANLRKGLFHEREILVKIIRKDCPYVREKTIVHYRDVYDHLEKLFGLTETYREVETSLMELYSTLLNTLISKMSNETNISVKRLTLIATIFMPLTLIASIGGMSEWTMMTGPENWKLSYPLFAIGMIVLAVFAYYIIRRMEKRDSEKVRRR